MKSPDDIPIEGFGWRSDAGSDAFNLSDSQRFRDSTKEGRKPGQRSCGYMVHSGYVCSRAKGHTGMHMGGHNGFLVFAK